MLGLSSRGFILPSERMIFQQPDEIIDLNHWIDDNTHPYQEGSREKSRVISPASDNYKFIKDTHQYLFKYSNSRYPCQFWIEILAYRLGTLIGVKVPPAHIGLDREKIPVALIEWFYKTKSNESFEDGGHFFVRKIVNFDRRKGKLHNFKTLLEILTENINHHDLWHSELIKMFLFDALIGNTDRHQDNWGIVTIDGKKRLAPAFDNGTAWGHEIIEGNLAIQLAKIETYIRNGRHHIRIKQKSIKRLNHLDYVKLLIKIDPKSIEIIKPILEFTKNQITDIFNEATEFNKLIKDPYKLSDHRVEFMTKLLLLRQVKILEMIKNEAG